MSGITAGLAITATALALSGCGSPTRDQAPDPQREERLARIEAGIERLRPLHNELGPPGPSDWLAHHEENGQTFAEYLTERPVLARGRERNTVYILPLGDFDATQDRLIQRAAEYLRICFGTTVTVQDALPLADIPDRARRVHPTQGMPQILTGYVLQSVLLRRLPPDAAAYVAFTTSDLWPGKGWNFVFGQAQPARRVGVWSLYRNGDPHESDAAYRLCLLRTIKTAVHEVGHIFTMDHCTAYECNMCGSNHREESDRHPLAFCFECVAKACWVAGADLARRYGDLTAFCKREGLEPQRAFFAKLGAALAR